MADDSPAPPDEAIALIVAELAGTLSPHEKETLIAALVQWANEWTTLVSDAAFHDSFR